MPTVPFGTRSSLVARLTLPMASVATHASGSRIQKISPTIAAAWVANQPSGAGSSPASVPDDVSISCGTASVGIFRPSGETRAGAIEQAHHHLGIDEVFGAS